jgi:transcriptional accessory protein Tex/SPT6
MHETKDCRDGRLYSELCGNGISSAGAEKYLNEDVSSVEDALQGARDIIAELVAMIPPCVKLP